MYGQGGMAYVYLCYGIHHLFNVVPAGNGVPHAVLVRAIEPTLGIERQLERRRMTSLQPRITAGPGSVSRAIGIDKELNGMSLLSEQIWIEDRGTVIESNEIMTGSRVGVGYAGEEEMLPWRFGIRDNTLISMD